MIPPDSMFEKPLGVRSIEVGGETVLFDVLRDRALRLNATGTAIWRMLDDRPTLEQVCRELAQQYQISEEEASSAANEFLTDLLEKGLVAASTQIVKFGM